MKRIATISAQMAKLNKKSHAWKNMQKQVLVFRSRIETKFRDDRTRLELAKRDKRILVALKVIKQTVS